MTQSFMGRNSFLNELSVSFRKSMFEITKNYTLYVVFVPNLKTYRDVCFSTYNKYGLHTNQFWYVCIFSRVRSVNKYLLRCNTYANSPSTYVRSAKSRTFHSLIFCEFVQNEGSVEMAAADHQNGGSRPSKWRPIW